MGQPWDPEKNLEKWWNLSANTDLEWWYPRWLKALTIRAYEEVFEIMKKGKQFGRLIVRIADEQRGTVPSKL